MSLQELDTPVESVQKQSIEVLEIVPGKILHFKGVLSQKECEEYINWANQFGWAERLNYSRDAGAASLRTSKRISNIEDFKSAEMLSARMNGYLPQKLEDGRTVRNMLEKFRFDKYQGQGLFKPHYDDSKFRNTGPKKGEASVFTVMVWLNEGYEGGQTHFLPCKVTGQQDIKVKGKTGDALVFWQRGMLHEGMRVTSGEKYIFHTNSMYSPHVGTGKRPTPQRFAWGKYGRSIEKKNAEASMKKMQDQKSKPFAERKVNGFVTEKEYEAGVKSRETKHIGQKSSPALV